MYDHYSIWKKVILWSQKKLGTHPSLSVAEKRIDLSSTCLTIWIILSIIFLMHAHSSTGQDLPLISGLPNLPDSFSCLYHLLALDWGTVARLESHSYTWCFSSVHQELCNFLSFWGSCAPESWFTSPLSSIHVLWLKCSGFSVLQGLVICCSRKLPL